MKFIWLKKICYYLYFSYIFFTAIGGSGGQNLYAQVFEDSYFRQEAQTGLASLYNFEFDKSHQIFTRLQKSYSDHPAPYFLLALNKWWKSYISTTTFYYDYIETHLTKALALNENYKDRNEFKIEHTFFQYMCYAFQTRLYILKREWLNAAQNGRKALNYLSTGMKYTLRAPEFYFSSGIYHYYAATYPQKHAYVRPFMIFFPDGDAELGLKELKLAGEKENFTQTEALYYLGDIYLEEEKAYDKAVEIKKILADRFPRNTWFLTDLARAYVYDRKYSLAEKILYTLVADFESIRGSKERHIQSTESTLTSLTMMRVYHYLGICQLKKRLAYGAASDYFSKSLKMAKLAGLSAEPHLPANVYYLGYCQDRMGNKSEAIEAYKKVLRMEENHDIVRQAEEGLARLR